MKLDVAILLEMAHFLFWVGGVRALLCRAVQLDGGMDKGVSIDDVYF